MELEKKKAIAALVRTNRYSPEKATEIVNILFSVSFLKGV